MLLGEMTPCLDQYFYYLQSKNLPSTTGVLQYLHLMAYWHWFS
jgi:hypothetical protein